MEWLKKRGFNAIRLLFNHQSVLRNEEIDKIDVGHAPQLIGMKCTRGLCC